ncbi:MAG TPA: ChbG/HpnK family deacetylase [Bacteroidota bacterium]|nr:ChbG/HpnK family deacetylase [Bacteroidota bacterium]
MDAKRFPAGACCALLMLAPEGPSGTLRASDDEAAGQTRSAIIRCDDIGMCHTVNMAVKEVLDAGLPISTSVMFACPWYQEAVDILKHYKNVSVGIHLTLNSEWQKYRWGPVAGRSAVPTLVDSDGYFYPTRDMLFANPPNPTEVERELRAQIGRAMRSGLRIDYVDYHMGTAVSTPELRALVERLAKEYRLGISRYMGETLVEDWYDVPPESKRDTLLSCAGGMVEGELGLFVFHIGLQSPEMDALTDYNPLGVKEVSRNRQAELRALTSPEFRAVLAKHSIVLKTYAEVIQEVGLDRMRAPAH